MANFIDVIVALCAAFSAFIGHLVAHDFIEFTPKLSRTLIERAAQTLPKKKRGRYLEEWLADLNDHTGTVSKLFHALGCVFGARRMRRQSKAEFARKRVVALEFEGIGKVELDGPTSALTHQLLVLASQSRKHPLLYKMLMKGPGTFAAKMAVLIITYKLRGLGYPDLAKAHTALSFLGQVNDGTIMKVWVNGKLKFNGSSASTRL